MVFKFGASAAKADLHPGWMSHGYAYGRRESSTEVSVSERRMWLKQCLVSGGRDPHESKLY